MSKGAFFAVCACHKYKNIIIPMLLGFPALFSDVFPPFLQPSSPTASFRPSGHSGTLRTAHSLAFTIS